MSYALEMAKEKMQHLLLTGGDASMFEQELANWIDSAGFHSKEAEFYRGLLDQIASHLGPAAFTADDGSIHDSPILLKLPELVAAVVNATKTSGSTFREYEALHRRKFCHGKADANAKLAEMCEKALAHG